MKAIIMAAGIGSRLLEISNGKPKCLITTGRETLISRMVRMLRQRNVDDITVITGYRNHLVRQELKKTVCYFDNPFYKVTNSIASLWLARDLLTEDVILMNADLFLEEHILDVALSQTKSVVMLSDSTRIETADFRFGVEGDRILRTGNKLTNDETDCEYVGVVRIDAGFIHKFKKHLEYLLGNGDFNNWWEGVLYSLIEEGVDIFHEDIKGTFWTEVDNLNDYQRLTSWLSKKYSDQNEDINAIDILSAAGQEHRETIHG